MISVAELDRVLRSVGTPCASTIKQVYVENFHKNLVSKQPRKVYINEITEAGLPNDVLTFYILEGMKVLAIAVEGKRKYKDLQANLMACIQAGLPYNGPEISQKMLFYMGMLSHEYLIGWDKKNKTWETRIYTRSAKLLDELYRAGAIEDTEDYGRVVKLLCGEDGSNVGSRVLSAFEKESIAYAKLEMVVVGNKVSIKLSTPNFRNAADIGTVLRFYPYMAFPYISDALVAYINKMNVPADEIHAIKAMQELSEGKTKERAMVFLPDDYAMCYAKTIKNEEKDAESLKNMLANNIKKTRPGWDCVKLMLSGFNVEASLYSVPYSNVALEKLYNIISITKEQINTGFQAIDTDSIFRLFLSRVNNWRTEEFTMFNSVIDTSDCENKQQKVEKIVKAIGALDDYDVYMIMVNNPQLFQKKGANGEVKSVREGLDTFSKMKPRAAKYTNYVELPDDLDERVDVVKNYLRKGACKISVNSKSTGSVRSYIVTNNKDLLMATYKKRLFMALESPTIVLETIREAIRNGKITNISSFYRNLQNGEVDGMVDRTNLGPDSTPDDWIDAINKAIGIENARIQERKNKSDSAGNPYMVNARILNADTKDSSYWRGIDVRNIVSFEFGEYKK